MELRDAAALAVMYFQDLTKELRLNAYEIQVEEVEQDETGRFWLITLGYEEAPLPGGPFPTKAKRKYKIFKIDNHGNKVVSMKIRDINAAS